MNTQSNPISPVRADRTIWTATGLEPQVFLDRTGRRAARVRLGGVLAAIAAAGWFGGILSGAAGFTTLPPISAALAQRPAVVVHHTRATTVRVASLRRAADPS